MYNLQTVSAIATIRVYVICYVNVEYKKNISIVAQARARARARGREAGEEDAPSFKSIIRDENIKKQTADSRIQRVPLKRERSGPSAS